MKIAPIILLCLMALSVIYFCTVGFFTYQIAKPTSYIEGIDLLKSLGNPSSYLMADPIDSPRPRAQKT